MTDASLIVVGLNERPHFTCGWHAREADGRNGVYYRWTMPEAEFSILVPENARALRLMVAGHAGLTHQPASFRLMEADHTVAWFPDAASTDFWSVVETPILPSDKLLRHFRIICEKAVSEEPEAQRVPNIYIPDAWLRNGDFREMGIMVAAIRAV